MIILVTVCCICIYFVFLIILKKLNSLLPKRNFIKSLQSWTEYLYQYHPWYKHELDLYKIFLLEYIVCWKILCVVAESVLKSQMLRILKYVPSGHKGMYNQLHMSTRSNDYAI